MFAFLHTYIPSPILITVGSISIHWYGFLLAAVLLLGYWLVSRLAKRKNLSVGLIESLYINLVIWGFVGARLYHVLNEWGYYWRNPVEVIMVWHGGLAIHGALAAGIIVLWHFSKKHQIGFYQLADVFSLPLVLGQGMVRWGNYFNQELFGKPTNLPWGIPIDAAHQPAGYEQFSYFHPTFLYESLWDLAVFTVLLFIYKRGCRPAVAPNEAKPSAGAKAGTVFWVYIGLYSLGRVGTELLRIDRTPLVWGARLPLLVSAVLFMVGAVMTWRVLKRA